MTNLRLSNLKQILEVGHHLISPRRDGRNGCRVLFFKFGMHLTHKLFLNERCECKFFEFHAGHWNPDLFSTDDIFRGFVYCLQVAASERETQEKGIVCVLDFKDFKLHQARKVTPSIAKKIADVLNVLNFFFFIFFKHLLQYLFFLFF